MKALRGILALIAAAICSVTAYAAELPDIYLRGGDLVGGWNSVSEQYKFTKEGDTYSLHLDNLNGLFKIASEDWRTVDFGGSSEGIAVRSGNAELILVRSGENLLANGLEDVTITFTLDASADNEYGYDLQKANVTFKSKRQAVTGLSGTLPVLYIMDVKDLDGNPSDEILSKDLADKSYRAGSYWLDVTPCKWMVDAGFKSVGSEDAPLPLTIKARGNYTRTGFAKKPFKLKLDKKQSLLGMSKSKHYAILAHADDNYGYMRNFTGFNLGKRIGLPWTPSQQPVEVVINGDYRGLYFLTESIRVGDDRVPVTELEDNVSDPVLATGGYLVELDNYDEENQIRMQEKGCVNVGFRDVLRITWDTPEAYSDLQKQFVTQQFSAMNDAVGANSDDLWRYMDLDDAARYYIVEEICSHTESYHGSTYLFRDRGDAQKWHFSPLWDMGNAFNGPTNDHFYYHGPFGNTWIASMMANNTFRAKVQATWLWFMGNKFDGIYDDLDEYAAAIKEAAKADRARWKDAPLPTSTGNNNPTAVVDNTDMDARLAAVKSHLQAKTDWLKNRFGNYSLSLFDEPERDNTPAAPLPEFMVPAAIADIDADAAAADANAPKQYFNLQGIRLTNPTHGTPLIERQGSHSRIVIL
ncbi:MAG: CotH kinase family protein [Candidatus Amulumruptor caecigallinarius]|nr:CotH kinase family protein [Candidatus Amulumruptor caecigallinarius]MCM1396512.1 CotH kinase family protein [Candidatus Amulumruptor caecigallinarius]MCM1453430.1 CotH kinase family protein [bacterium]